MKYSHDMYEEIVDTTSDYLGPAAERFVQRQIEVRLNKEPEQIAVGDMEKITHWLRISLAFISDDKEVVEQYATRLSAISEKFANKSGHGKTT